jgi:hypothetical protein
MRNLGDAEVFSVYANPIQIGVGLGGVVLRSDEVVLLKSVLVQASLADGGGEAVEDFEAAFPVDAAIGDGLAVD